VAAHADGVNVSFVNDPDDVEDLCDELDHLEAEDLGVILKIETRFGFENLPEILLAAMERPKIGVMIARGDLAAEVGWLHLGRVQRGNPLALRSGSRAGGVGDSGTGEPGQEGRALALRDIRCCDGTAGRVRHAQQGRTHGADGGDTGSTPP